MEVDAVDVADSVVKNGRSVRGSGRAVANNGCDTMVVAARTPTVAVAVVVLGSEPPREISATATATAWLALTGLLATARLSADVVTAGLL